MIELFDKCNKRYNAQMHKNYEAVEARLIAGEITHDHLSVIESVERDMQFYRECFKPFTDKYGPVERFVRAKI